MQNHKAWLKKALNDLKGAKVLFKEKINDLAVYHCHLGTLLDIHATSLNLIKILQNNQ